jgi:Putative hemolysin
MPDSELFQIDLKQILRAKAPQQAKKIPGFLISLLSRIICRDGLNDFLRVNNNATGVDFMKNAVKYFEIDLKLKGEENIPPFSEKAVFVANHPLGGLDGICLSAVLGEKYNEQIKYLVNDLLYFIEPLKSIFVPINKHGYQAKGGARSINEAFHSENQIITFPAGICSRKIKGKIRDVDWKKMFIVKAVEYKRNVVPVYFEARNTAFFYTIANIRKALKIKFNLEMLLLPSEMFKSKGSSFTIYFGKPIPWQTFDSSKSPRAWSEIVKEEVYQLKNKVK